MKNKLLRCIIIGLACALYISCEENEPIIIPAGTVKIVHAVDGAGPVRFLNFAGSISFSSPTEIDFGSNARYTVPSDRPTPLKVVPVSDTLNVLLEESLSVPANGSISTLFLLSGSNGGVQSFQIPDDIIIPIIDSIAGVRFANLSLDTNEIAVGISGNNQNEVEGLSYQEFSDYVAFPAKSSDGTYTFEFRDAMGTVLTGTTLDPLQTGNVASKKNLTFALIGRMDDGTGNNTLQVARINNY